MSTGTLVQFRGRSERVGAEVHITLADEVEAAVLSGEHAAAAERALVFAVVPIARADLARQLIASEAVTRDLAEPLLDQLVEALILDEVVPAAERVRVVGDDAVARYLRYELARRHFPARFEPVALVSLGNLRSAHGREVGQPVAALAITNDAQGVFIGPRIGGQATPCEECLWLRRRAILPADYDPERLGLPGTPLLAVVAAHALRCAELVARGGWRDDSIWHVRGDGVVRRTLLSQPRCPRCSAAPAERSLAEAARSFAEVCSHKLQAADAGEPSEARTAAFVDPVLGPIQLEHFAHAGLYRDLPLVVGSLRMMQPGSTGAFVRRNLFSITFGPGSSESRRRLIAFAEGIERYAGFMEQPDVSAKRASELGVPVFVPRGSGYADQRIDWSLAYEWTNRETRLLPHDAFAISRAAESSAFRVLDEPFSSGFAAHRTLSLALGRALYELIERDALLLAWYLQLPLTELRWNSDDPTTSEMSAYLRAQSIELRHFDLRVDFDVPCVLTLARAQRDHGPWRAGGYIVAASAGRSWADVRRHALEELVGHFSAYGVIAPDGDKHLDAESGEKRPWWPAFAEYLKPRSDQPFAFLDGRPLADFPSEGAEVDLQQAFRERALPVFVRPLGARDAQRSGLEVVRAFVPGLLRLTPSRETFDFDEPRIAVVREKWRAFSPFNPLPHPLT